jgi:hypothetical protein
MAQALRRAGRLRQRAAEPGRGNPRSPLVISGVRAVAAAIRACRAGTPVTSPGQLAWLAVVLAEIPVRDAAWTRMDPAHRHAHQQFWTTLTRLAPAPYTAAPATLLAITAWQDGNGALAQVALDRALDARPDYPMAQVIREVIDLAVPPSDADPARLLRAIGSAGSPGRRKPRARKATLNSA